jgi:hypothetical protein
MRTTRRLTRTTLAAPAMGAVMAIALQSCGPVGDNVPDGTQPTASASFGTNARINAVFQWSMPDQFGSDMDGDGAIDLTPSPGALNALWTDSWQVTLDACASTVVTTTAPVQVLGVPSSYTWSISQNGGPPTIINTASCATTTTLHTATYSVALTASAPTTGPLGTITGNAGQTVAPKNYVIVSMGDSQASGEGNPIAPAVPFWTTVQTNFGSTPKFDFLPATWGSVRDQNCHRSANSSHARAALGLERASTHSSVMFVSAACSGTRIPHIIDASYAGQEPLPGISNDPQIKQVREVLCPQGDCRNMPKIDAALITIGGNDIKFSDIVHTCAAAVTECSTDFGFTDGVYQDINKLWPVIPTSATPADAPDEGYANLNAQLSLWLPTLQKVFVTEYPDPTHDQNGNTCEIVLQGASPIGTNVDIGVDDVRWASQHVIANLNLALSSAAAALGWHYIGNISSAFNTSGYCALPLHRIINYNESFAELQRQDGTLHPNVYGQTAIALAIAHDLSVSLGLPDPSRSVPVEDPVVFAPVFDATTLLNSPAALPAPNVASGWAPAQNKAECSSTPVTGLSAFTRPHSLLCRTPLWGNSNPVSHQADTQPEVFATSNSAHYGARGDWDYGFYKGECEPGAFVIGMAQDPTTGGVDHLLCGTSQGSNSTVASSNPAACQALAFPGNNPALLPDGDWAFGYYKLECGNGQVMVGASTDPGTHLPHAILCCNTQ